ncbi:MAG: hypothetical protein VCB99_07580 [Myxococcota bacterium]
MASLSPGVAMIRRRLVVSGALTAGVSVLLLLVADSQRLAIARWIAADPTHSLTRMRGVLVGLSLVGVSPLLFYAGALLRFARRRGAAGVAPLGEDTQRKLRASALLLFSIACAIPLGLWWLAAFAMAPTP